MPQSFLRTGQNIWTVWHELGSTNKLLYWFCSKKVFYTSLQKVHNHAYDMFFICCVLWKDVNVVRVLYRYFLLINSGKGTKLGKPYSYRACKVFNLIQRLGDFESAPPNGAPDKCVACRIPWACLLNCQVLCVMNHKSHDSVREGCFVVKSHIECTDSNLLLTTAVYRFTFLILCF